MKLAFLNNTLLVATLSALTVSCGKKDNLDTASLTVDSDEASIESGITMVQGLADDQSGGSYSLNYSVKPTNIWTKLLLPNVYAEACSRAIDSTCNSGVKSANYASCQLGSSSKTMSGYVTLTFSQPLCTLLSNGDFVTRTYDVDISGPRGGLLSMSSDTGLDYNGNSYGGGGVLTKTASGYEAQILGRHTQLSFKNKEIFNVSVRTLTNLVYNQLSRNGRVWSSGQLEVNHNLAKFTSTITPNNVTWSSSCCHPVSGNLNVVFSGSKSGSATVTFNGCGSAQLEANGQTKDITLSYCE